MAHAETCPTCWGKGKIKESFDTGVDNKTCHGCLGKGWVSVADAPQSWCKPQSFAPNVGFDYLRYMGFNSETAVR